MLRCTVRRHSEAGVGRMGRVGNSFRRCPVHTQKPPKTLGGLVRSTYMYQEAMRVVRRWRACSSRSVSDIPPQMPYGSATVSAWLRHCIRTGTDGTSLLRGFRAGHVLYRVRHRDGRTWRVDSAAQTVHLPVPDVCVGAWKVIRCRHVDSLLQARVDQRADQVARRLSGPSESFTLANRKGAE